MNNSELELELIARYGLDSTILFAEMVSTMYNIMHEDMLKKGFETYECAYDYESGWWLDKHNELLKRRNVI